MTIDSTPAPVDAYGTLDQQITSAIISGVGFAIGGALAIWILGFTKKGLFAK